ncbi:riboflavin synthase [Fundidesulfovibrio butyratiphilus]
MFTGLVQGKGRVSALGTTGGQMRLTIDALFALDTIVLGESIAVNGACLTVESFGQRQFSAYASAETLRATTLGDLARGSIVNLERALALGDRLGGHMVSGHVDCVAKIVRTNKAGESVRFQVEFPKEFASSVIPKGSVALDGVSLTINECGEDWLAVNVIPATQAETTIADWRPGARVNMETDVLGKYVARMLGAYAGASGGKDSGRLTEAFLRENGF